MSDKIAVEATQDEVAQQIDRTAIEQHIRQVISDQLGVKLVDVGDDARLQGDLLNADSLDIVELVMALEDDLGIEIEDDAVEHIQTVRQMIDYVISLIQAGAQANP